MSVQMARGATVSNTVTLLMQLAALPLLSVTVRLTLFRPVSPQSKCVLSAVKLAMAQLSKLPASRSLADRVPEPEPSR